MPKTIHSLNLSQNSKLLEVALGELHSTLTQSGIKLDIAFHPFPLPTQPYINQVIQQGNIDAILTFLLYDFADTQPDRPALTIYWDRKHPLARAARARLPHAAWGLSIRGLLSITYTENKYAIWHETLHLLNAEDHYDLKTFRTTCELATCIMQYAPDENTVGDRPCLCQKTRAILAKFCAQ